MSPRPRDALIKNNTLSEARFDLAQGAQANRALKLILIIEGFLFQLVGCGMTNYELLPVVVILAALVLAALVIQTRFRELVLNHGAYHLDILKSETAILSQTIKVVAIVVLLAGTARAQVIPGDSPNMGIAVGCVRLTRPGHCQPTAYMGGL